MDGFEVIDRRYRLLYDRACEVFGADERVLRVEVHGSVATGSADEWSDLDLKIIVRDEDHRAVVDEWKTFVDTITPTVFAQRPIAPFVINTVTADGLTFDLSFWPEAMQEFPMPSGLAVGLFGPRFSDYPAAIDYAVNESLRGMSGPLVKFLKRGEHVAHFMGVGHTLSLLQAVLLAEADAPMNSRKPAAELDESSLATLAGLPPVAANYESLLTYELAVGEQVITRGRKLFAAHGLAWPAAFETVAARSLKQNLGVVVDWLAQ